jgi:alpha-1,2-mannosyltransferase
VLSALLVVTVPPLFTQRELRADFAAYYYAARVERQLGNVYDSGELNLAARSDGVEKYIYPYLYPPLLCKLMSPLALLAPLLAQRAWLGFNLACLALLMVVLTRFTMLASGLDSCSWRVGSAIAATGALVLFLALRRDLRMGQVNIVITLLIAGALYLAERRRAGGGALLAFASALKVLPAILALLLLAQKRFYAVFVVAVSSLVLVAVMLATMGREVGDYLAMSAKMGYGRPITAKFAPDFFNNLSFGGFFCRFLGVGAPLVGPLSIACILALVALGAAYRRALVDPRNLPQGLTYATCLMIVASPVVWLHHLVYLLPAACAAVAHVVAAPSSAQRRGARVLVVLMVLCSLPFENLYLALFGERLPTWTMSILIPNLFLILALMGASIRTARRTATAPG